ncbi:MAG TPA: ABC transporter substrate-binding protein [Acetobacteraceae bacterium]|nr:ABC transporter substrate-binding protein [Acetobacteraceae bacterium]
MLSPSAELGRARPVSHRILSTALRTLLLTTASLAALPAAQAQVATGSTGSKTIALSNSYAGNSFRQVMIKDWERVTHQAVADKTIAGATVVNADNSVTQQASQMQNLILQGYSGIAVLAASSTALNGVVNTACHAGITVVSFAGIVTAPCAYQVNYDWGSYGRQEIDYIAKRLNGHGNILEIRGIAGDSTDADISAGVHKAIKDYPGLKIVGTVYGQWTSSIAQREVAGILPSLPEVDAVVTQGGDGYGAAKAFEASGRKLPIIIMGNRQDELAWWKQQHDKTGYETFSISATPSISEITFWVTQQILAGKKVPKLVEVPLLRIDQNELDAYLKSIPVGGVANPPYPRDLVVKIIDANINHTPMPPVPPPQ